MFRQVLLNMTLITYFQWYENNGFLFLTTWMLKGREKIILFLKDWNTHQDRLDIISDEFALYHYRKCITAFAFDSESHQLIHFFFCKLKTRKCILDSGGKTSILSSLYWLLINTGYDFKVHLQTHELQLCKLHSRHHTILPVLSVFEMQATKQTLSPCQP